MTQYVSSKGKSLRRGLGKRAWGPCQWQGCRRRRGGEPPPPISWDEIGGGSVVLATTGPNEGWFESAVIEMHGDLLKLKWCGWPDEPLFARKITQVGLLPPAAD